MNHLLQPHFVTREFEQFIAEHTTHKALQIRFLQTLRTFVLRRGRVERHDLVDSPFTQLALVALACGWVLAGDDHISGRWLKVGAMRALATTTALHYASSQWTPSVDWVSCGGPERITGVPTEIAVHRLVTAAPPRAPAPPLAPQHPTPLAIPEQ